MIEAITPDGFLELSADIAYRLSGQAVNPRTLLDLVLKDKMEDHQISRGNIIILTSVGAGMTINSIVYKMPD